MIEGIKTNLTAMLREVKANGELMLDEILIHLAPTTEADLKDNKEEEE